MHFDSTAKDTISHEMILCIALKLCNFRMELLVPPVTLIYPITIIETY